MMMKIGRVFAFLYICANVFAAEVDLEHFSFKGEKDFNIVYTKFGTKKGELGTLVISPGRAESSLKHSETALDFVEMGYSPVFIINLIRFFKIFHRINTIHFKN